MVPWDANGVSHRISMNYHKATMFPDSASRGESRKLFGVQYLRAAAALMVSYLHLLEQAPASYLKHLFPTSVFDWTRFNCGVDIFFVISGFIMLVTSKRSTPGEFVVRRIIRIVPLYWLLTLAIVVAFLLRPTLFPRTTLSLASVIQSLLFVPYINPGFGGELVPILYPGWTLNFEMYFYAIFALVLFSPLRFRVALNGLVFFVLLALRYLYVTNLDDTHSLTSFYTSPKIFEFWSGMIIGAMYLNGQLRISVPYGAMGIVSGFLILLFNFNSLPLPYRTWGNSTLAYLLPAALIVLCALASESARIRAPNRFLTLLGDASYSIYLSHIFFLAGIRTLWHWLFPVQTGALQALGFGIVSMSLVVLGGLMTFWVFEQPMLRLSQRCFRGLQKIQRI